MTVSRQQDRSSGALSPVLGVIGETRAEREQLLRDIGALPPIAVAPTVNTAAATTRSYLSPRPTSSTIDSAPVPWKSQTCEAAMSTLCDWVRFFTFSRMGESRYFTRSVYCLAPFLGSPLSLYHLQDAIAGQYHTHSRRDSA